MATLISAEKAQNFGVNKSKNGVNRTDYIVKCVFSNSTRRWQETGGDNLYGMNLTLSCSSVDEGEKLIAEFKADTSAHAEVQCHEFSVHELLKDSDKYNTIESIDYVGTDRTDVRIRRIASFDARDVVRTRESARLIKRLDKGTVTPHK